MEKLIKLINEYGKTSNCGPFEDCRIEPATDYNSSYLVLQRDDNGEGDWKDWFLDIPRLISKEYGFIQRLVKHFMLNMTKIDARIALSDFNATDRMLMALAISDNPLELLIDCLD